MKKRTRRVSTLGSRATSLVSVCLVLLLLGIAACVGIAASNIQQRVRQHFGFVVVMERGCPVGDLELMKKRLHSDRAVETYAFTSAEAVLEQEAASLGEDILAMAEANPYSAEFDVRVRQQWANADSVAALADSYAEGMGVADIISENETLQGADTLMNRVSVVLGIVAVVLLVISIGLINNTVSLSIYGRRFTIHVMKLVGATAGFIRRPFVLAALGSGIIAGIVAGAVLLVSRWYIGGLDSMVDILLPWVPCVCIAVAMVPGGGLLCWLTAFFAARRYLRASYDEMFMK